MDDRSSAHEAPGFGIAPFIEQIRQRAVICLDPHGVILTWNQGARDIKGYEAHDIVGRGFEVFYRDVDRAAGLPASLLATAARDGVVKHVGARVRADGSTFWGDVVISSVRDDDGALLGFVKVTGDLSALRAGANDARTALRAATRDARNPLAAASGLAELLELQDLDPAADDYVARLRSRLAEVEQALHALDGSIGIGPSGTIIESAQADPIEVARRIVAGAQADDRVAIGSDGYAAAIDLGDLERVIGSLTHGLLGETDETAIGIDCSAVAGLVRITIDASPASVTRAEQLCRAPAARVHPWHGASDDSSVHELLDRVSGTLRFDAPDPSRVVLTIELPGATARP